MLSWLTAPTYWPFWNKRDAHGKACACLPILVGIWGRGKCTWNGADERPNSASANFTEMVQVAEIKAIPYKTRCFGPEAVLDRNALSATNSSFEQCEKRWLNFA